MSNSKAKSIVSLVVALVVIGIVIGYVFPIAMSAINNVNEKSLGVTETEEIEVEGDTTIFVATDGVDDGASEVNFTFNDTKNGDSYSESGLAVGDTVTIETSLGDMDVTLDSIDSATECTMTFEYSDNFGWSSSERALSGLFGIMIILVLVMSVVGMMLVYLRKSM